MSLSDRCAKYAAAALSLLGLLSWAPSRGASPASAIDQIPGKLPKTVVPLDYEIAIVPHAERATFDGTESVTIQVRSSTDTVVFNVLNLNMQNALFDGKAVKSINMDNDRQIAAVTLGAPAGTGRHVLKLQYSGAIQEQPQGLFLQRYGTSGDFLLSTELEATDARRVFPCWDEPAFRARFRLTVTIPSKWTAVANMPIAKRSVRDGLSTITFARTPRMASYLVELTAGNLKSISEQVNGVRLGIWAVAGREQEGRTALANARQILADYEAYFGYKYPLPKLDSIAIPGGFSGAMENWGAITYTDRALLLSTAGSLGDAQNVYSIQAHEMAHQWNGDLVTMAWWDDLWLNESFASWMAAKETDQRNPSWNWWELEDAAKQAAMAADARASSHPIQVHVSDELQATSAFDPVITYNKGEMVLRMLEAYLGPEVFRDGLRRYMRAHAFGNATTSDLWDSLSAASGQNVRAIAADWTEQPGYPLIRVTAHCESGRRTISLSQQRFYLSAPEGGQAVSSRWHIPLQVRVGKANPQAVMLAAQEQSMAAGGCEEALSADAGAIGYFRVAYDDETLAANTRAFADLPNGDRIALLDDQWALVEAQQAPLGSYLRLTGSMGSSRDPRGWQQITAALSLIEHDERNSSGHAAFAAYARTVLRPLADQMGWESNSGETPAVQQLRREVLEALATWGDRDVIDEARKRFEQHLVRRKVLSPDDQEMIFSIVGQNADAAAFEKLLALAKASDDSLERHRMFVGLAKVKDVNLAATAGQIVMSDDIRPQEALLRWHMINVLHDQHAALAWSIFTRNSAALLAPMGQYAAQSEAEFVPEVFWDSVPLDQLQQWVKAQLPAELAPDLQRGMDAARLRFALKAKLVPAADSYVSKHTSG